MMNLIVTCARHLEGETENELIDILDELGDSDVTISVSSMSGIITVQTKLDPIEVVRKMVAQLPEHQKKDTIELLKRSVADMGRTLGL